jgi:hypothetical protein
MTSDPLARPGGGIFVSGPIFSSLLSFVLPSGLTRLCCCHGSRLRCAERLTMTITHTKTFRSAGALGGLRLPSLWTNEGRCGTPRGACALYFSRPRLVSHGHDWATSRRPAPGDFRCASACAVVGCLLRQAQGLLVRDQGHGLASPGERSSRALRPLDRLHWWPKWADGCTPDSTRFVTPRFARRRLHPAIRTVRAAPSLGCNMRDMGCENDVSSAACKI